MSEIPQSDADVLLEARDLISEEGHWCQGDLALTSSGRSVRPNEFLSPGNLAVSYCLDGAVIKAIGPRYFKANQYVRCIGYLNKALGSDINGEAYIDWNDDPERTQAQVVGLLDSAATLAKEA